MHVPETKNAGIISPAHRPLGIYHALGQLYGTYEEEGEEKLEGVLSAESGQREAGQSYVVVTNPISQTEQSPEQKEQKSSVEEKSALQNVSNLTERRRSSTTSQTRARGMKFWNFFKWKNIKNSLQKRPVC